MIGWLLWLGLSGCWTGEEVVTPEPSVEQAPTRRRRKRMERTPVDDDVAAADPEGVAEGRPQLGKWRKNPLLERASPDDDQERVIAELEAIGYADGTMEVAPRDVIVTHDRQRAWQGLNLYNSGHASEAFLADMDGTILHTWKSTFAEAFPESKAKAGAQGTNHWRRVMLGPEGSLFGIFEGRGIVKLDREGRLLWAKANKAHHDMLPWGDGGVMVLTRAGSVIPDLHAEKPVLEDFIEFLDADGSSVRRVSLLEALMSSEHASELGDRARHGDVFHTNSLQVLGDEVVAADPAFAPGRVLVSMRTLSAVGVVDLETERFVWFRRGIFKRQHDVRVVAPDRLMLFDNQGNRKHSRVLVYQLPEMTEVWRYGGTEAQHFVSATLGTSQPLPGGNVLITSGDSGRALEVTAEGEVVWEFFNPHRAGLQGEFIGALFEVVRLPEDTVDGWLELGASESR